MFFCSAMDDSNNKERIQMKRISDEDIQLLANKLDKKIKNQEISMVERNRICIDGLKQELSQSQLLNETINKELLESKQKILDLQELNKSKYRQIKIINMQLNVAKKAVYDEQLKNLDLGKRLDRHKIILLVTGIGLVAAIVSIMTIIYKNQLFKMA